MAKFCSIIFTHFGTNTERSQTMRKSLLSLIEHVKYPYELIVVDNGPNEKDSSFFLDMLENKRIHVYVKNMHNMHFGYARNQGVALSRGEYICIVDNDLLYTKDWLTPCVGLLETYPEEKIYTTPMYYPMIGLNPRYHVGFLQYNGLECELHRRAGSNCFVIRRTDFEKIGLFKYHRIAGSLWTDSAVNVGFNACVIPQLGVTDIGLRKGYDLKHSIPIKLDIANGESILLNQD